ncbi:hypothetical protein PAN31108_00389 [Pandoraea anhela]|uniref:Uncharacterized protein n=1 Tax=Pandoraea anhela TaxID=2508295 RepID=A0A5E4RXH8_9BURK|nr:hypothetical protein PAN31108_00389 [Pandoraea anhela]
MVGAVNPRRGRREVWQARRKSRRAKERESTSDAQSARQPEVHGTASVSNCPSSLAPAGRTRYRGRRDHHADHRQECTQRNLRAALCWREAGMRICAFAMGLLTVVKWMACLRHQATILPLGGRSPRKRTRPHRATLRRPLIPRNDGPDTHTASADTPPIWMPRKNVRDCRWNWGNQNHDLPEGALAGPVGLSPTGHVRHSIGALRFGRN